MNLITLVRLADHLTRVHELSGIERKYWFQFAKLQNTNVVRVYEKEVGPKTIFSINQRAEGGNTTLKCGVFGAFGCLFVLN